MTDVTPEVNLEHVDFGDAMLNELAHAEKRYRTDVWFQGLVTEARFEVSKNPEKQGLQFRLAISLLESEGRADSVDYGKRVNVWVNTPWNALPPAATALEEADRQTKAITKRDMMTSALYALFGGPDFVELPRRIKGEYRCENGSTITRDEYQARAPDAHKKALNFARKLCQAKRAEDFLDCAPYLKLRYEDDSDYPSIDTLSNTLPPGEQCVPASQAFVAGVPPPATLKKGKKKR